MVGQRLGRTAEMAVRKGCVVFETAADLPRKGAYFGAPCSRFVLTTPPPQSLSSKRIQGVHEAFLCKFCVDYHHSRQMGGIVYRKIKER